MMLGR